MDDSRKRGTLHFQQSLPLLAAGMPHCALHPFLISPVLELLVVVVSEVETPGITNLRSVSPQGLSQSHFKANRTMWVQISRLWPNSPRPMIRGTKIMSWFYLRPF